MTLRRDFPCLKNNKNNCNRQYATTCNCSLLVYANYKQTNKHTKNGILDSKQEKIRAANIQVSADLLQDLRNGYFACPYLFIALSKGAGVSIMGGGYSGSSSKTPVVDPIRDSLLDEPRRSVLDSLIDGLVTLYFPSTASAP